MGKDKVVFKDFGKETTDRENRDECLKAYICAVEDVPAFEIDGILKGVTEDNKDAFIDMIYQDMKGRIERFLNE